VTEKVYKNECAEIVYSIKERERMADKKEIGKIMLIGGYSILVVALMIFIYSLEYQLALQDTSILKINLADNFGSGLNLLFIYLFIVIIIAGHILYSPPNFSSIKKISRKLLVAILFILEVGLSSLLTYLIVLGGHLSERANIGYLIAILISIFLIDNIRSKIN